VPLDREGFQFCNWITQGITEQEAIKIDSTADVSVNIEGVIIKNQPAGYDNL
jgi:hypothetical protein